MDSSRIEERLRDLDRRQVDNIKNIINLYKTLTLTLERFVGLKKQIVILEHIIKRISQEKFNVSEEELKQLKEEAVKIFEKEKEINKLKQMWQLKQEQENTNREEKKVKNKAAKKIRRNKRTR